MSKVIRAMKKVYWKGRKKIKKLPPVKAAKKYMGRKRKDKLLYETLPAAYNAHKNEPVDERKVIFIELRLPDVSNSFRILYDELQRDFDLDIHVHLLRNSFVPREEYIRRCKEMLADAATAKYIFVNEASDVLSCVDMRPETIVTQLWHACGAFKKFGINLLREGLDIPEITLVAILDADKEGFLRSETSLVQTIGRAARNVDGHVIMYADVMTDSMKAAIEETERRRTIQEKYNKEHNITPRSIKKAVRDLISISKNVEKEAEPEKDPESMNCKELESEIAKTQKQAAAELDFEKAAELRDRMIMLKKHLQETEE